jgi:hypothetical protein
MPKSEARQRAAAATLGIQNLEPIPFVTSRNLSLTAEL